jgi:hypothetical protein
MCNNSSTYSSWNSKYTSCNNKYNSCNNKVSFDIFDSLEKVCILDNNGGGRDVGGGVVGRGRGRGGGPGVSV